MAVAGAVHDAYEVLEGDGVRGVRHGDVVGDNVARDLGREGARDAAEASWAPGPVWVVAGERGHGGGRVDDEADGRGDVWGGRAVGGKWMAGTVGEGVTRVRSGESGDWIGSLARDCGADDGNARPEGGRR
jgi:hypothetical protein